jgi:hypothetical protein
MPSNACSLRPGGAHHTGSTETLRRCYISRICSAWRSGSRDGTGRRSTRAGLRALRAWARLRQRRDASPVARSPPLAASGQVLNGAVVGGLVSAAHPGGLGRERLTPNRPRAWRSRSASTHGTAHRRDAGAVTGEHAKPTGSSECRDREIRRDGHPRLSGCFSTPRPPCARGPERDLQPRRGQVTPWNPSPPHRPSHRLLPFLPPHVTGGLRHSGGIGSC